MVRLWRHGMTLGLGGASHLSLLVLLVLLSLLMQGIGRLRKTLKVRKLRGKATGRARLEWRAEKKLRRKQRREIYIKSRPWRLIIVLEVVLVLFGICIDRRYVVFPHIAISVPLI